MSGWNQRSSRFLPNLIVPEDSPLSTYLHDHPWTQAEENGSFIVMCKVQIAEDGVLCPGKKGIACDALAWIASRCMIEQFHLCTGNSEDVPMQISVGCLTSKATAITRN
jgi:hypothetical protein